mmetsp:Transcript_2909/g.5248  ORF Transcript_2909/g.5248 Transcript_2909/m.5248 type:complete len:123 (-) Transcript_2909:279-647(-)|eukprot:CAMPEP_0114461908 /NCGR_PEP_ID=MMETSP0104-20121206/6537_1 /TAXON_ID=37642 ORGANISM="Paraphysomonas imperforata, Strain PA2" /NCGR_SAMPLE_ID=MMETSP0104 /ASSEMBLY_ACC=CAM_ASM_000202 /LENGTH=122 /DNA_ID=CAMNT_0001634733 /DNA_START=55 /DNA_END=423 /DNA_ORIENTATION=+
MAPVFKPPQDGMSESVDDHNNPLQCAGDHPVHSENNHPNHLDHDPHHPHDPHESGGEHHPHHSGNDHHHHHESGSKPARRCTVRRRMMRRASNSTMHAVHSLLERIPSFKKTENDAMVSVSL